MRRSFLAMAAVGAIGLMYGSSITMAWAVPSSVGGLTDTARTNDMLQAARGGRGGGHHSGGHHSGGHMGFSRGGGGFAFSGHHRHHRSRALCAPAITTAAGIAGGIGAGSVPTPIDPGVLETTVQRLPPAAAARICATNVESHGFRKGSPRILDAAKLTDFERDASLGAGYWAVEVASVVHANWMPAHHE